MRLIDADKLIDSIPKPKEKDEKISRNAAIADIMLLICDAPTAYDTDKVVQGIESGKRIAWLTLANTGDEGLDEVCQLVHMYLSEAIEVVKKGGIDE